LQCQIDLNLFFISIKKIKNYFRIFDIVLVMIYKECQDNNYFTNRCFLFERSLIMLKSDFIKYIKELNNSLFEKVNHQSLEALFKYFRAALNAENEFYVLGPIGIKSLSFINNIEKNCLQCFSSSLDDDVLKAMQF